MRVQGASHALYVTKRKLQQAKQFTVEAVHCLERLCIEELDEPRTLISGAMLFCVFACARWSDIAWLEHIWIDEFGGLVLVEGETSKHIDLAHKGSQIATASFLPLEISRKKSPGEGLLSESGRRSTMVARQLLHPVVVR